MTTTDPAPKDIRPLRAHCTGPVVVPGERGFAEALSAWDVAPDDVPAAVAFPVDGFDVAAIRAFARYADLRVVTQDEAPSADGLAGAVLVAGVARARRFDR